MDILTPEQDLHNIEIGIMDCLHRHSTENGIDKPAVARELGEWIQDSLNPKGLNTMDILTKEQVNKLIQSVESELQSLNETERECQPGGKPSDRLISFEQHISNMAQLYMLIHTLEHYRDEAERLAKLTEAQEQAQTVIINESEEVKLTNEQLIAERNELKLENDNWKITYDELAMGTREAVTRKEELEKLLSFVPDPIKQLARNEMMNAASHPDGEKEGETR